MCNCLPFHCCVFPLSLARSLPPSSLSSLFKTYNLYIDKLTYESAFFNPPTKSENYLDVPFHCLPWAAGSHHHVYSLKVNVAQSCPTLCHPGDYTVHGTLQARALERVAYRFSRGSSQPRNRTGVSCIAGGFFINRAAGGGLFTPQGLCLVPSGPLPQPRWWGPLWVCWHHWAL